MNTFVRVGDDFVGLNDLVYIHALGDTKLEFFYRTRDVRNIDVQDSKKRNEVLEELEKVLCC